MQGASQLGSKRLETLNTGFVEFICPLGHYFTRDMYDNKIALCDECNQKPIRFNLVDTTNGKEPELGLKNPIGYVDKWHRDHHGNRYATKLQLYAPMGQRWSRL